MTLAFQNLLRLTWFFVLLSLITGCTALVDATTKEPIDPDPTKRTLGTYIDDQQLETIARVNLRKTSDKLKASNIQITVYNGVALLTGQVPDQAIRAQAARVVSSINRIRQVHNELEIRSNATFWMNRNDQWIGTKVKAKLIQDKDIDSSRVKYRVENGSVFLMGLLSHAQAEKVTTAVAGISGVIKVVRVFEYVE